MFADPDNLEARYLCADALEQLGYQAESGPWRNAYLSGALELREGSYSRPEARANGMGAIKMQMTTELMLDYMGICLDSDTAQDLNATVNLRITDRDEQYLLTLRSGVLLYQPDTQSESADATWTMPSAGMFAILSLNEESMNSLIEQEGDTALLGDMCEHLTASYPYFSIVEP